MHIKFVIIRVIKGHLITFGINWRFHMLSFSQNRSHSLEQSLKEGYSQMADLNLSLANEAFPIECEACDCNETYLSSNSTNE